MQASGSSVQGEGVSSDAADLRESFRAAGISAPPIRDFITTLGERGMALHSLHVVRHGVLAVDHWQWPHLPALHHSLHSVTKSFTGTAVGFALAEGLLSLDDRVAPFFAGRFPAEPDENMRRMRVRDLLTMRAGNTREISGAVTRRRTDGWINDFLAEPVAEAPGGRFVYSSMSSHALSAIVQQVTGLSTSEYLRPRLFEPLEISDFSWQEDPDGVSSGGNGLSLTPTDLLKFGQLYLHDGVWKGRQVLPPGWAAQAGTPHAQNDTGGYGYQFWCLPGAVYSASGIFGQECMIFPHEDAVVSITGAMGNGSYHDLPGLMHQSFSEAFGNDVAPAAQIDAVNWITGWSAAAREPQPLATHSENVNTDSTYRFEPNEQSLHSIRLRVFADSVTVDLHDDRGSHTVRHGIGTWTPGRTGASVWRLHHSYQDDDANILAAAEWDGPQSLTLRWHFVETPFTDTLTLTLVDDQITLRHNSNINSGPTELPPVVGTRKS